MKDSIISILLKDSNVNLYTKLLIFLFYKAKNDSFNISDREICKRLKLDIKKHRKLIYKTLKKIEKNKTIKIYILHRKRFFKFNKIEEEKPDINNQLNELLENFNWLEN